MHIQRLTSKDVPRVLELGAAETAFQVGNKRAFWTREQLMSWAQSSHDVLLVARNDQEEIIGFSLSTLHKPTGKATWENLYVVPEARGSGVGTALTNQTVEQLRHKGATHFCFLVRKDNKRALEYFKGQGFQAGNEFVWFGG